MSGKQSNPKVYEVVQFISIGTPARSAQQRWTTARVRTTGESTFLMPDALKNRIDSDEMPLMYRRTNVSVLNGLRPVIAQSLAGRVC